MPGKKRKRTRNGFSGCPPCELPDIAECYTNGDIISAMNQEKLTNPMINPYDAALKIRSKVISKFRDINPRLIILEDKSISNK